MSDKNISDNQQANVEMNPNAFLQQDFQNSFEQMRHYDRLELEYIKFAFSGYAVLLGGVLTLFQAFKDSYGITIYLSLLLLLGSCMGVILFAIIVRNRNYFVHVARFVNEIRDYYLKTPEFNFENKSGMYHNYKAPKLFQPKSTYSFLMYLLALLNAVSFSLAAYMLLSFAAPWIRYISTGVLWVLALGGQLWLGIRYLRKRETKTADEAVHGAD